MWKGVLVRRMRPVGPADRTALAYTLLTEHRGLDVYAANADALLGAFANRRVVARGKLVDLSGEGYGEELWLASIEAADRFREDRRADVNR